MGHDVFISYAHPDKEIADAACAALEQRGVRCWIAPRDVLPGAPWGGAIVEAIHQSLAMVVIFSSSANESHQVIREIERAVNRRLPVIPFRVEAVSPSGDMEYFLSSTHWLDALTPPLERHIESLCAAVQILLDRSTPLKSAIQGALEKTPEPQGLGTPDTTVQKTPKAVSAEVAERNRSAIILFLAIIGLLFALPGPLAWYLARYQIRTIREKGSLGKALTLAKSARIIGIAGTGLLALYVALFFATSFQRNKQETDMQSYESNSEIMSSDSTLTTEPPMMTTNKGTPEEVEHTTNITTLNINVQQPQNQNTISIYNKCNETINVAILYETEQDIWVTKGWFTVKPRETLQNVVATQNSNVYFYADSPTRTWDGSREEGSIERSITDQAFEHPDDTPFKYDDAREVSFFYTDTGNTDYTQSFTCEETVSDP